MDIKKIYLDMDGVIVDFDAQFENIIGVRPENSNKEDHYKNFSRFVNGNGFVYAPVMENAKKFFAELYAFCDKKNIDLYFLTSDGSIREFRDQVREQKIQWLQDNGFWLGESKFILSNGWRGKGEYANNKVVLIDDTERNVNLFTEKGGHAILYSSTTWGNHIQALIDNI